MLDYINDYFWFLTYDYFDYYAIIWITMANLTGAMSKKYHLIIIDLFNKK